MRHIFSFLILFNGHKRMNPSFPGSCVFWVSVPRQILWWAGDQSGSGHTHGFIQSCSTEQEVLRFPRSRFSTRRPFAASPEIVQRVDWRFTTDAIRNLFIKQTHTFSPPLSRAHTHPACLAFWRQKSDLSRLNLFIFHFTGRSHSKYWSLSLSFFGILAAIVPFLSLLKFDGCWQK